MGKKNTNKFTIGFDMTNEIHIQAVEILDLLPVRKKAGYIAQAIVKYNKGAKVTPDNNTGKRKRGRPPKKQQTVVEVEKNSVVETPISSKPVGNANASSQYISDNHTASVHKKASDAMVDSMMAFLQD